MSDINRTVRVAQDAFGFKLSKSGTASSIRKPGSRRELFLPDAIAVPDRLRSNLNEESVARLMESIGRLGLQTPLTVRWNGNDAELVAGRHRLEACRRLGISVLDCVVFEGSETDARLWEIAENLHRAELTEAERRQHIAEWVRLTAEKDQSPHRAAIESKRTDGRGHRPEEAIAAAARDLGISKDTVARAVAAEGLSEPVKAAADAAGLGTVARAEVAREADAEAQAAKVRDLAQRKADRKMVQSAGDEIVERDANDDAAALILDYLPDRIVPQLLSYLDAGHHHKLSGAIRRELKTGNRNAAA